MPLTEGTLEASLGVTVEDLDDDSLAAGETSLKNDHHLVLAEDRPTHG